MGDRDARFGERLRRLREAAGLTQEELAVRAGLTAKGIASIERGRSRRPYPQTLRGLADALGLAEAVRDALFALAAGHDAPPEPAHDARGPEGRSAPLPPLPVPATPLLGREDAVGEIVPLLAGGGARLVTLTGPGGVGKTRLAMAVAGAAAVTFPDGVAFVPLLPLADPALVIPAIAYALGLRERGRQHLSDTLRA